MLRRRAGSVEGRDRWGAAEELLLYFREALDSESRGIQHPFLHREEEKRPERASWRLAPASAPYLAIWCGECAKWWDWEMDMCEGDGVRMGWTGRLYRLQHVRNCSTATKRDAALSELAIRCVCLAWTFVDCSLCLLQVWCVICISCACLCCISLHILVLSRVAWDFTVFIPSRRFEVMSQQKEQFLHIITLHCKDEHKAWLKFLVRPRPRIIGRDVNEAYRSANLYSLVPLCKFMMFLLNVCPRIPKSKGHMWSFGSHKVHWLCHYSLTVEKEEWHDECTGGIHGSYSMAFS